MTAKSGFVGVAIGAFAICSVPTREHCLAQEANYLEMLQGIYMFDSWAGQTEVRYAGPVTNWVPDFGSLEVITFLRREEGLWTNSQKYSRYSFLTSDQTEVRIDCVIDEREDTTNAHLAMLQFFSFSQAWQPFPLGSSLGVDIGDRCYLGWGAVDSVFFVRNNVFVFISGGYSAMPFAERLDSELVARSFPGPVLLQADLRDGAFHVSVPTVAAKTYVIESEASLTGTNWSSFSPFTGDGTVRLVTLPVSAAPQRFFRLRVQ